MGDIFGSTPGHFGERQTDIAGTTVNYGGRKGTTFTQHIGGSSFSSNGDITTRIGGTSYINGEQEVYWLKMLSKTMRSDA